MNAVLEIRLLANNGYKIFNLFTLMTYTMFLFHKRTVNKLFVKFRKEKLRETFNGTRDPKYSILSSERSVNRSLRRSRKRISIQIENFTCDCVCTGVFQATRQRESKLHVRWKGRGDLLTLFLK